MEGLTPDLINLYSVLSLLQPAEQLAPSLYVLTRLLQYNTVNQPVQPPTLSSIKHTIMLQLRDACSKQPVHENKRIHCEGKTTLASVEAAGSNYGFFISPKDTRSPWSFSPDIVARLALATAVASRACAKIDAHDM